MSDGIRRASGLTETAVSRVKPKARPYKLSDRDGLYLLIEPSGRRVWRMNFRLHGKQRTISFGRWPEILLSDAREQLLDARRLLAKGIDPTEQAKLEKIAVSVAAAQTFEAVAKEWLDKITAEGAAPMTLKKARWLLSKLYPAIGNRPITLISAHELLLALRKIEASKRYNTANRARTAASQIFRYGIATGRAERDVASDLRGALITPRATHRAAITTPLEAGALLRSIDDYEGNPLTRTAMRFEARRVFRRQFQLGHATISRVSLAA